MLTLNRKAVAFQRTGGWFVCRQRQERSGRSAGVKGPFRALLHPCLMQVMVFEGCGRLLCEGLSRLVFDIVAVGTEIGIPGCDVLQSAAEALF